MDTRIAPGRPPWISPGIALFALLFSTLSVAQQAQVPAPSVSAKAELVETGKTAPQAYRSALDSYQPYTDEKIINWKEANDLTARIGGWRAYAKEASGIEPESAKPAAKPLKAQP